LCSCCVRWDQCPCGHGCTCERNKTCSSLCSCASSAYAGLWARSNPHAPAHAHMHTCTHAHMHTCTRTHDRGHREMQVQHHTPSALQHLLCTRVTHVRSEHVCMRECECSHSPTGVRRMHANQTVCMLHACVCTPSVHTIASQSSAAASQTQSRTLNTGVSQSSQSSQSVSESVSQPGSPAAPAGGTRFQPETPPH
jgi:hypothetical protein